MKPRAKQTAHRLVAVLSLALAFAIGEAWATDRTWNGGTGGTEANPLDIYSAEYWNPSGTPTSSDNLTFSLTSGSPTVLTNTLDNADTTILANKFLLNSGDFTFRGGLQISGDMQIPDSGTGSISAPQARFRAFSAQK